MNASAALLRRASPARAPSQLHWRAQSLPRREIFAFCALALLASLRFAALLAHPPVLRVLGIVAALAVGTAALSCTRSVPRGHGLAAVARALIVLLTAYLALRAAGIPARLLWPWRWAGLVRRLDRGLGAFDGLWPYRGELAQAREALMFALALATVPAAMLAFWPSARHAATRRALALALLLALYLTGAMNEPKVGWQVQGVLLLALLGLWFWAWRAPTLHAGRAAAWLLVGGVLALGGADLVHSGTPLVDYGAWNPFGPYFPATSFNWNQKYGPLSWPQSTETMVSVASPAPHFWRATTLERFNGVGFQRSDAQPSTAGELADAALNPRWVTHATFTVRGLSSDQLLSPGQIISASITGNDVPRLGEPAADGTLSVSGATPHSGQRYTVIAYVPHPSAAEMRRAPRTFPSAYAPYTEFDLPARASLSAPAPVSTSDPAGVARVETSPYARVYALARGLAYGAPTSYDVVARTEAFLEHGFTYSLDPPRSAYPLVSFLFGDRTGYCQQFSGAMTLMLRMDGIPARVAAGFVSGSPNSSTGLYEVSALDAHAWVEVFFAGIGWVSFDPTPANHLPSSSRLSGEAGGATQIRHRALPTQPRAAGLVAASHRASPRSLGKDAAIVIGLAAALAVLLGAAWWAAAIRTGRALEGDAEGALRELSRALERQGVALAASTTLAELERRLESSHGPAASRYVRLLRERRYAPHADPQLPSLRDRRLMRQALHAHRGPLAWLRALFVLPPVIGRARRRPLS